MPIKKTFSDKKNYSKENFQEYIRSSDWSFFWMSQNANEMMLQFCIIVEQAINVHEKVAVNLYKKLGTMKNNEL